MMSDGSPLLNVATDGAWAGLDPAEGDLQSDMFSEDGGNDSMPELYSDVDSDAAFIEELNESSGHQETTSSCSCMRRFTEDASFREAWTDYHQYFVGASSREQNNILHHQLVEIEQEMKKSGAQHRRYHLLGEPVCLK